MRKFILFNILFISLFNEIIAQKIYDLNTVVVSTDKIIDTVFGTWKFSVADYEFYEDHLILLTYEKNLRHSKVVLTNAAQNIISSFEIPDDAVSLYKDYLGYINVLCAQRIYRISVIENKIHLGSLPYDEYKSSIMPCIDTVESTIYFSNYNKDYPEFSYFAYNTKDSSLKTIHKVCDPEVLHGYNMEYYFLKPHERVNAMYLADYYKVDKHRIAAMMRGLTTSMFYTPLYSPLVVMNDTTYIFDHSSNAIFKFDIQQRLFDSIKINYNHPKNWKEWKHKIIIDKENKKAYALYEKSGFYYLNQIDLLTGCIKSSYKLANQYVDNLKIKNGYVYYVYSPFESLQEFFVYKELIN